MVNFTTVTLPHHVTCEFPHVVNLQLGPYVVHFENIEINVLGVFVIALRGRGGFTLSSCIPKHTLCVTCRANTKVFQRGYRRSARMLRNPRADDSTPVIKYCMAQLLVVHHWIIAFLPTARCLLACFTNSAATKSVGVPALLQQVACLLCLPH